MKKIELINLTLDEIRRSTTIISDVYVEAALRNRHQKDEILEGIMNDCDYALENARKKLRDVLENVANFQNEKDMICGVDIALTKVSYDIIYERKKECDYE